MKLKFFVNLILILICSDIICAKNKFVIVIPSYNNSAWVKRNLDSVFDQTYKNFRVIYIDDISTDGTGKLVESYVKQNGVQKKLKLIKNQKKMLALGNTYNAVHSCDPSEIVVILDGDDWFANKDVLSYLNEIYKNKHVWITFGSFRHYPSNVKCEKVAITRKIISENSIRKDIEHIWFHLRSFYAGLFQRINIEHLMYEGKFFEMAGDLAYMAPMLEMAGEHSRFLDQVLYVWNMSGPNHDFKKNAELQGKLSSFIRNSRPYDKLNSLL